MSGWTSSKPPWETSDQPVLPPDESYYGRQQGARVVIRPHVKGGHRAGRGYEPPSRSSRGLALFGVFVGLAAAGGITYGAVLMTHVTWGVPDASAMSAPPSSPAVTASASPSAASAPASPSPSPSATAAGNLAGPAWTMATPATAAGYHKHTPMPAAMLATGTKNATALISAVELAGAKPDMAGKQPKFVSADYLVPGNQAIGYVGFTGTFDPAAVMTAFGKIADNVSSEPAGSHGGKLDCGSMSADNGPGGEVCVWATTTSMGMVGFFGSGAPEHVPGAKAGEDTVKLRGGVEVAKQ